MKKAKEEKNKTYLEIGIPVGLCLGVAYGIIFDNLPLGIGIGLCLGTAIGSIPKKNNDKNQGTDNGEK